MATFDQKLLEEFNKYRPSCLELDDEKKQEILTSYKDKDKQQKEEKEFFEKYSGRYFARMDFDLNFSHKEHKDFLKGRFYDRLYVGEKDLQDSTGKYLIVDWRSPVGFFVNEDKKRNLTVVEGNYCSDYELMLKRKFLNSDDFEYSDAYVLGNELYDNGDVDKFLIKVLEKLRKEKREDAVDIIETLQYNQSEIIHQSLGKNFFVQGCAGSGKTMVMLHRLSWILYNNKGIDTKKIKIITPNNNIIEQIRELTEQLEIGSIRKITTEEYYLYLIQNYSPKIYRQLLKEGEFKNESTLNSEFLDYVYSDGFKKEIDKAYTSYFDEIFSLPGFESEDKYSYKSFSKNLENAVEIYLKYFPNGQQGKNERYKRLLKCVKINGKNYEEKENLKERIILQIFKDSTKAIYEEYKIASKGFLYKHMLYIMLHILQKFYGGKRIDSFLNIDEAQDITPNEYKAIMFANQDATYNLYGDTQQLLYKNRGISDWGNLPIDAERFDLKVNYRNAKDITDFCNKKVSLCDMESVGVDDGCVYHINEEEFDGVVKMGDVVVVKDIDVAYELFGQSNDYNFVKNKEDKMSKEKPNVFTVETVKGGEFSGDVYVIDKGMTENEKYIAYTRALKSLILVN